MILNSRNGRSVLNMSCRMLLPLEYGPVAVTSHYGYGFSRALRPLAALELSHLGPRT